MSEENPKLKPILKCEATTNPCFWWDSNKIKFPDCSRNASIEIDGLNLCLQHAGTLAVLKLVGSGEAKKLDQANKNSPICGFHNDAWADKVNL